MPYLNFNSAKPFVKMTVTFLSIVSIGIIVFFIGILATKLIYSLHLDDVNHAIFGRYEHLTDGQLKLIQIFQTLGFFILPGIFLYWLFSSPSNLYFETKLRVRPGLYILTTLIIVVAIPFINWIIHLNDLMLLPDFMTGIEESISKNETIYDDLTRRLISAQNLPQLFLSIFMIGVLPAIGEEFIFRGIFQRIFREVSGKIHLPVILAAFIFSFVHGQFHGFFARFLLGIFLGYIMEWGKTIWLPVLGHFMFNTMNVILYYFLFQNEEIQRFQSETNYLSFLILPASILLTVIFVFIFYKISLKPKTDNN